MKKAKHTAGPYQYDYYGDHASFCGSENYLDYAFRVEFSEEMPEEDRIGTCNLIEAAPELLDALEISLSEIEAIYFEKNRASKTWAENEEANKLMFKIQAIRAAIAKAKGEA